MCLTLGWLHFFFVCCLASMSSSSLSKYFMLCMCKTALRRFAIHLWEIVTNIYLKALDSNCLSHKNNVWMYLTQCECRDGERKRKAVTAIPFEMINKFYYYLSSLKVAANTLQRIMYRIPTLTCRHARFSQKANSSKPVKHWKERTTRTNDQTEEWAEERERDRGEEKKIAREKPFTNSHFAPGFEWIRLRIPIRIGWNLFLFVHSRHSLRLTRSSYGCSLFVFVCVAHTEISANLFNIKLCSTNFLCRFAHSGYSS